MQKYWASVHRHWGSSIVTYLSQQVSQILLIFSWNRSVGTYLDTPTHLAELYRTEGIPTQHAKFKQMPINHLEHLRLKQLPLVLGSHSQRKAT